MVAVHNLLGLLEQIAPHVSKDKTLPALCGVRIETDDSGLYAVATDRYTMAVVRRPLNEERAPWEHPWTAWLDTQGLKTVTAFARAIGRTTEVGLEAQTGPDGTRLHLVTERQTLEVDADMPQGAEHASGTWRQILTEALASKAEETPLDVALNPGFIARWGKVDGNDPFTVWSTGEGKPVVFARGEEFIGFQMPVRLTSDAGTRESMREQWAHVMVATPEQGTAVSVPLDKVA